MTTSPALRTLPPMRAEDLLHTLVCANRFARSDADTPFDYTDLPLDPTIFRAFHILAHPRFVPALHTGPDASLCPDCLDLLR